MALFLKDRTPPFYFVVQKSAAALGHVQSGSTRLHSEILEMSALANVVSDQVREQPLTKLKNIFVFFFTPDKKLLLISSKLSPHDFGTEFCCFCSQVRQLDTERNSVQATIKKVVSNVDIAACMDGIKVCFEAIQFCLSEQIEQRVKTTAISLCSLCFHRTP